MSLMLCPHLYCLCRVILEIYRLSYQSLFAPKDVLSMQPICIRSSQVWRQRLARFQSDNCLPRLGHNFDKAALKINMLTFLPLSALCLKAVASIWFEIWGVVDPVTEIFRKKFIFPAKKF